MNFSQALVLVKAGKLITRKKWGKQFIFMVNGSRFTVNRPPLLGIFPEGTEVSYKPHIDIKIPCGDISPFTPTQEDLFAEDWEILENAE